jgi:hypothetical protein
MDRSKLRFASFLAAATVLAAVVASAAGCRSVFTTVAYLIRGTDAEAEYKGLEKKKVVVVCRPVANLSFGNPTAAADLARQVAIALKEKGNKIQVIDQQKVADWTDNHDWNDYPEVGKALKADMVVGIDLQEFVMHQSNTIYQGQAAVAITVYDCAHGDKVVFEKSLPRTLYPPNIGIQTSELPEGEFRRKFISVLADQIGRHFYSHDAHADLTQDLDAIAH